LGSSRRHDENSGKKRNFSAAAQTERQRRQKSSIFRLSPGRLRSIKARRLLVILSLGGKKNCRKGLTLYSTFGENIWESTCVKKGRKSKNEGKSQDTVD